MKIKGIDLSEWVTPNTYGQNYKSVPEVSGVYLLVYHEYFWIDNKTVQTGDILYVGSAKNLLIRYNKHEVKRMLTEFYGAITFYFKEESNYREVEKSLIKILQPKYNKQWR